MHEDPQIPDAWRIRVRQVLAADEPVLAWFEPDLDARLFFTRGLVVLTDRRLLEWNAAQPGPESAPARQWPLRTDLSLQHLQGWPLAAPAEDAAQRQRALALGATD